MIGLFGFAGSGKTTLFQSLTKSKKEDYDFSKPDVATAKLPDERLEFLGEKLNSQKITFPELSFIDIKGATKEEGFSSERLAPLKDANLIIYCLKGFGEDCNLSDDLESLELELICYDLELTEKKLSPPPEDSSAKALFCRCQEALTNGIPLRDCEFSEKEKKALSDIPFLSIKNLIILINKEKESLTLGDNVPPLLFKRKGRVKTPVFSLCAGVEKKISELPSLFLFLKEILNSLSLITFYTVVKNEARAWLLPEGTPAVKAAGKIHTDIEKGFIRAEVLDFEDFKKVGSLVEAKHQNLVHSENKEYLLKDGDIIEFLFSK